MTTSDVNTYKQGLIYTAGSYFLWGILPLYWKTIENVSAEEILAHRIFWSFLFMLVLLTINKDWKNVIAASKRMVKKPIIIISLVISSLLISTNWFVYIWAVNNDHMIEASLGYYINPLISVLLGMVFLKERLNLWQKTSMCVAALGVIIMAFYYGNVPWIAIILAISFGLYGLTKKMTKFNAIVGLTFETLVVTPIAAYYLVMIASSGKSTFFAFHLTTNVLLIGAGIATAIPLLLFASGAQRIPLFMVGVLQYIAPTITLLIGILIYKEPFTSIEVITFMFIWTALILFTLSNSKYFKKVEIKLSRKSSIGL